MPEKITEFRHDVLTLFDRSPDRYFELTNHCRALISRYGRPACEETAAFHCAIGSTPKNVSRLDFEGPDSIRDMLDKFLAT